MNRTRPPGGPLLLPTLALLLLAACSDAPSGKP